MTDAREALRGYVHFLRDREGVRDVRLTRAARAGLANLVVSPAPSLAARAGVAQEPVRELERPDSVEVTEARGIFSLPEAATALAISQPTSAATLVPFRAVAVPPPPAVNPPLPTTGSTKAEQLAHLNSRAQGCVKCPHLAARRHTVVFGVGNPDAQLAFIGEGPGEEEDLTGEPFVGRAGQLLTKMISAMGLTREDVYIANIVKCRPDMPPGVPGNRKPTRQEMDTCLPYLRAQLDVIKPAAIVALGATSVDGLIGAAGSMGSLRGKFLEYRGIPLMPTYHPSYLLRNQSNTEKRKVWEDLLKVMERLGLPVTEKQRGFFLAK